MVVGGGGGGVAYLISGMGRDVAGKYAYLISGTAGRSRKF